MKGYKVWFSQAQGLYNEICVEELEIFAQYTVDNTEYCDFRKRGIIWTSVLGSVGKSKGSHGFIERGRKSSIFFTIDEVKEHIKQNLAGYIQQTKIHLEKMEHSLEKLNNLDLDSLPKDDYISPFTGLKT